MGRSKMKDGSEVIDVEEGQISGEDEGIQEISEHEFKPNITRDTNTNSNNTNGNSVSREWSSYYNYSGCSSNFGSNLHNFAWFQAVQNKPLSFATAEESTNNEQVCNVISDDSSDNGEKEEGELEEGEIDLDADVVQVVESKDNDEKEGKLSNIMNVDNVKDTVGDDNVNVNIKDSVIDGTNVDVTVINNVDDDIVTNVAIVDDDDDRDAKVIDYIGRFDDENVSMSVSEYASMEEDDTGNVDLNEEELDEQVQSILEALDTITVEETTKSFHGVCSQLRSLLEKLQSVIKNYGASAAVTLVDSLVDSLVEHSFMRIQIVNSVYASMSRKQQEVIKDVFIRLLLYIMDTNHGIFQVEQMKEIEDIEASLNPQSVKLNIKEEEKKTHDSGLVARLTSISTEKFGDVIHDAKRVILEPILSTKSRNQYTTNVGLENSKPGSWSKGSFGPLLDLNMDHDADSLPSPTREATPSLPRQKLQAESIWPVNVDMFGSSKLLEKTSNEALGSYNLDSYYPIEKNLPPLVKHKAEEEKVRAINPFSIITTSKVSDKNNDGPVLIYDADAHKAVTTYQNKFGGSSFFLNDMLPSPTPSEDGDEVDDGSKGEVSSSSIADTGMAVVRSNVPQQIVASVLPHMNKPISQLNPEFQPVIRPSAKSRDPRLRLAKPNLDLNERTLLADTFKHESPKVAYNSRKRMESTVDVQSSKKQRKELLVNQPVSRDLHLVSGSGRWLNGNNRESLSENTGMNIGKSEIRESIFSQKQNNGILRTSGNDQLHVSSTDTSVSLPSSIKDVIVNPTMLMQLIMERQRVAAEAEKKANVSFQSQTERGMPSLNYGTKPGTIPLPNTGTPMSSEAESKPPGNLLLPIRSSSTEPQGELGKIRMKPRDPRRILLNNTTQKNDSVGSEQFKSADPPASAMPSSESNIAVRQKGEQAQTSAQPGPQPDIARQFTSNLKNLADILSSSQPASISTSGQAISSQSIPSSGKADIGVRASDPNDMKVESGILVPSSSTTTWNDVEHLFEGYDDKEKAAIQTERTRRIEEQNSMFAARKLCLVLDLDHTLLNSAKFVEVDRVHEEMLRKKEEADREKPQRHLFRFPHLSMWTKLRPGIWTFLEKASKLFELHLYTMGNNVYAKEMAKVLDPTGALFAGRVISKGDDGDVLDGDEKPKSKDLEGVLGMESSVVIIDDSIRVWPHNKLNLIVVERYTYFPCSRRQFGLLGPSLLEIDHDERPEDGTIASCLAVIERIHDNFFSNRSLHDGDVRNILAMEQKRILAGCRIVFSRIFPLGGANHTLHPLWQTAEQFGAVCTTQIDEKVTHVVANSLGTDKVNWALATGKYVVQPGWVEASALLYRRANEHDFAVKP